jgi:hypothetical protein
MPKGGVKVALCFRLTSTLGGDGWLMPRTGCFTPGKETRYPCSVGPSAGAENLAPSANRHTVYAVPPLSCVEVRDYILRAV